jgi:hypothetical protein
VGFLVFSRPNGIKRNKKDRSVLGGMNSRPRSLLPTLSGMKDFRTLVNEKNSAMNI